MSEYIEYEKSKVPLSAITLENICGTEETTLVSFWAPRREEVQRFVEIAKTVHKGKGKPKILDVGCGNGFLAYLLAATGEVEVIGLDPDESLIKENLYAHPSLRLEVGDSQDAVERYGGRNFDVVLNSWMPNGLNLTPDIRNIGAKVIIYIEEAGGATGCPDYNYQEFLYDGAGQQGRPNPISPEDAISYHPGGNYQKIFSWSGPACDEVQFLARRLKNEKAYISRNKDLNFIEIQFRRDVIIPKIPKIIIPDSEKYAWEKDLERFKGPVNRMRKENEYQ